MKDELSADAAKVAASASHGDVFLVAAPLYAAVAALARALFEANPEMDKATSESLKRALDEITLGQKELSSLIGAGD